MLALEARPRKLMTLRRSPLADPVVLGATTRPLVQIWRKRSSRMFKSMCASMQCRHANLSEELFRSTGRALASLKQRAPAKRHEIEP